MPVRLPLSRKVPAGEKNIQSISFSFFKVFRKNSANPFTAGRISVGMIPESMIVIPGLTKRVPAPPTIKNLLTPAALTALRIAE